MLAVLNRYRILLIILSLLILAIMIWFFITSQNHTKPPTKGVFVLRQTDESRLTSGVLF